jgi:hypothetical protein
MQAEQDFIAALDVREHDCNWENATDCSWRLLQEGAKHTTLFSTMNDRSNDDDDSNNINNNREH